MALIMKHLKKFCLLVTLVAILVDTCQGIEGNNDIESRKISRFAPNAPRRFRRQVAHEDQRSLIAPNEIPDEVSADDTDNSQINVHRRADLNPGLAADPHLVKAPAAEAENESDKFFVQDDSERMERESPNNILEVHPELEDTNEAISGRDLTDFSDEKLQAIPKSKKSEDSHQEESPSNQDVERLKPVKEEKTSNLSPGIAGDNMRTDNEELFTLFTIANTDIGTDYEKIPFREQYRWDDTLPNCESFNLKIPDEKAEKSMIKLCIFRPYLEFPDETELFILNPENENSLETKALEKNVYGFVMNHPGSTVKGKIIQNRFFFGEISIPDENGAQSTYFVEDIHLVFGRMHINDKSLRHMLMVMNAKNNVTSKNETRKHLIYNAAVTKGASLNDLLDKQTDPTVTPFLMLTTNHNSYICFKEPQMSTDDGKLGKVKWGIDQDSNTIDVDNDVAVKMRTAAQDYTFRPNGRTVVMEGTSYVQTLQEHEGPVAITAYTKQTKFDCVLPTPSFDLKRRGGYLCKVCVVADKQFAETYNKKNAKATSLTQNYVGKIIDRVSWIFRSVDWDNDKKPDNIGLSFDSQSQPLEWGYPNEITDEYANEQSLIQSLEEVKFPDDCCLGIGYTMKLLPDSNLEAKKSPYGSSKQLPGSTTTKSKFAGLVCNRHEGKAPNNLIVISAKNHTEDKGATSISENQLIYLTAHKIGAAFGANLDATGKDICDQFVDEKKQIRHYLMWPSKVRNMTLKEQTLSSCSKADIMTTLATCQSSCFDNDEHLFCGNGIVEVGEECDCGSEYDCDKQTCCYPRNGENPCHITGIGCKNGAFTPIMSGMSSLTLMMTLAVTYFQSSL